MRSLIKYISDDRNPVVLSVKTSLSFYTLNSYLLESLGFILVSVWVCPEAMQVGRGRRNQIREQQKER